MRNRQPKILMIRPKNQAKEFMHAFCDETGECPTVVYSPVSKIIFEQNGPDLTGVTALLFTSANAVRAFAGQNHRRDIPCFTVGETTDLAAKRAGLDSKCAAGDVTDLQALVEQQHSPGTGQLAYLRGDTVSGALANNLWSKGYRVVETVVYRQVCQKLEKTAKRLFETAPVVLPVFSPLSATFFKKQVLELDLTETQVVAISAKAAAPLNDLPFRGIFVCSSPNRKAMIDGLCKWVFL